MSQLYKKSNFQNKNYSFEFAWKLLVRSAYESLTPKTLNHSYLTISNASTSSSE